MDNDIRWAVITVEAGVTFSLDLEIQVPVTQQQPGQHDRLAGRNWRNSKFLVEQFLHLVEELVTTTFGVGGATGGADVCSFSIVD